MITHAPSSLTAQLESIRRDLIATSFKLRALADQHSGEFAMDHGCAGDRAAELLNEIDSLIGQVHTRAIRAEVANQEGVGPIMRLAGQLCAG